jgi:hypothetical protein
MRPHMHPNVHFNVHLHVALDHTTSQPTARALQLLNPRTTLRYVEV